jgi:hypothetical protein
MGHGMGRFEKISCVVSGPRRISSHDPTLTGAVKYPAWTVGEIFLCGGRLSEFTILRWQKKERKKVYFFRNIV